MTGAECLLRTLVDQGVEVCFLNPGTSEMHFVSALDRVPGMRAVLGLFEGVCSGAADGYGRMLRRPAATLLHLGPGLANGLANFHNARKARTPIVSIVGEHATQHLRYDAPLSADLAAFARTVTSEVRTATDARTIGALTSQAIEAALRPPGRTSMLLVPADLSWSEAGSVGPRVERPRPAVVPVERILDAARLIRSGRRVGVLVGGSALVGLGLERAGQLESLGVRIFADRNGARYERGRGRFPAARLAYFPEQASAMLEGLEVLLLVEAQAPVSFFGYPDHPSYLAPRDCEVVRLAGESEDGPLALESLAIELEVHQAPVRRIDGPIPMRPADGPLTVEALGTAIASLLPENSILSEEMVSSAAPVLQALENARAHDLLPVTGGSIGQALPVAVGAAIACPGRKVIALEGDGSGMYTPQALWTMARERLDVTVVIFANRAYRILEVEMRRTGAAGFGPMGRPTIDIGDPDIDWVKLAVSMGVSAGRALTVGEFTSRFEIAMRERGPWLIEAVLS